MVPVESDGSQLRHNLKPLDLLPVHDHENLFFDDTCIHVSKGKVY